LECAFDHSKKNALNRPNAGKNDSRKRRPS
jgi:hypothetical protein